MKDIILVVLSWFVIVVSASLLVWRYHDHRVFPALAVVVSACLFVWLYHGIFPVLGLEIGLDPLQGALCIRLGVQNGSRVAARIHKIELQILEHSMSEVETMLHSWPPLLVPSVAPVHWEPKSRKERRLEVLLRRGSEQIPGCTAPTEWIPFSYDDRTPKAGLGRWREPIQVLSSTEYVSPGETVRTDLLYPARPGVAVHCGLRVLLVPTVLSKALAFLWLKRDPSIGFTTTAWTVMPTELK
jgi:hypothetical protein